MSEATNETKSNTEQQLVEAYNGPLIPLRDVCEVYFGLGYEMAARQAATGDLPVPAFRVRDSQKAPLVMRASELAAYIDKTADSAHAVWLKAQA